MRLPLVPAAICLVLLAGCLPSASRTTSPIEPSGSAGSLPSEPVLSAEPSAVEPTAEPIDTPEPPPPSDDPGNPSPSGSSDPGPAAACTGSEGNREFYAAAADTLRWAVYCAVLPAGWFVEDGEYRTAAGGHLMISYKGPGGGRFELREGAFCGEADGCVPAGTDAGDGSFGDKPGTLIATDDGGWAVVVDRGEEISWLAIGEGLAEDRFRAFTSSLAEVDG